MTAWKDFAVSLKTWQAGLVATLAFLSLITGALGQFLGLFTFITEPYRTLAMVALLYLGGVILLWLFTFTILTKKERKGGDQEPTLVYSRSSRVWAWVSRVLVLLPIWWLVNKGYAIDRHIREACHEKGSFTGILVTKFTNQARDEFSLQLINYLSMNLDDSLMKLENIDQYVSANARVNFKDSLSPLLNCYKNGMIVFGSRNISEKSFFCNLYLQGIATTGQKFTGPLEPPSIEMPIDIQLDRVGKFVLTQLYYTLGNTRQSMAYIDTLLQDPTVQNNASLKSVCFLYKGLNQVQNNQYLESIQSFETAYNTDKRNAGVQNALSYMRSLKFYQVDFSDTTLTGRDHLAQTNVKSEITIQKGLPINDSIAFAVVDIKGSLIKDTVLPVTGKNFIILSDQSKWFTFYLDKGHAFRLGKGSKDSLVEQANISTWMAREQPLLKFDHVAREWEKVNDTKKDYY